MFRGRPKGSSKQGEAGQPPRYRPHFPVILNLHRQVGETKTSTALRHHWGLACQQAVATSRLLVLRASWQLVRTNSGLPPTREDAVNSDSHAPRTRPVVVRVDINIACVPFQCRHRPLHPSAGFC